MPPLPGAEPRLLLLVDDDDDIRAVAAAALELVSGFRTVTASNGLDAVKQARQHHPDGIILDVMMPGMDGLQTVEILKSHSETAGIPVVMLTARVDGDEPPGTVAGVISKPFDPMRLGDEVSRIFGWTT